MLLKYVDHLGRPGFNVLGRKESAFYTNRKEVFAPCIAQNGRHCADKRQINGSFTINLPKTNNK
jgi:hypothetical protein